MLQSASLKDTYLTYNILEKILESRSGVEPPPSPFQLLKVCSSDSLILSPSVSLPTNRTALSLSQLHSFMTNGFLQIKDVVPMHLINKALRLINHRLGQGDSFVPQAMHTNGTASTVTPMAGFKLAGNVLRG
jgi:hypothetical protein